MANHGGARPGAGRPQVRVPYKDARPDGILPLDFMLGVLRDETAPGPARMQAAKDAAPYCHARLQATQLDVESDTIIELVSYLAKDE